MKLTKITSLMGLMLMVIANVSTAQTKLSVNKFEAVRGFGNGGVNYYQVVANKQYGKVISAHYTPPKDTVTLALELTDQQKKSSTLSWKWRVSKYPAGADERVSGKGDSAGAVYCFFKSRFHKYVIKYVNSETVPVGTVIKKSSKPFSSLFIVVKGNKKTNTDEWHQVSVNFKQDFKRLFDEDDALSLNGIGIMSDGDQTKSEVITEYADFYLSN